MPRPTHLAAANLRVPAPQFSLSAPRTANFALGVAGLVAIGWFADEASPQGGLQVLLAVALIVGTCGLAANLVRLPGPAGAPAGSAPAVDAAAAALQDLVHENGQIADLRVLMAEDNPLNQLVVHALLNGLVGSLTIVSDGVEALEALRRQDFDLVLMDVNMPHLSGPAAVAAVRAGEAGRRDMPIVALTGEALRGDAERFRAAGFDAYLAKPFQLAELLAVVSGCAHQTPAARRAAA